MPGVTMSKGQHDALLQAEASDIHSPGFSKCGWVSYNGCPKWRSAADTEAYPRDCRTRSPRKTGGADGNSPSFWVMHLDRHFRARRPCLMLGQSSPLDVNKKTTSLAPTASRLELLEGKCRRLGSAQDIGTKHIPINDVIWFSYVSI